MERLTNIFNKSNSTYEALMPILFVGRVSSITPFKFHIEPGKSKAVLFYPYIINTFSTLCIYLYCFATVIMNHRYTPDNEKELQIFIFTEILQMYIGFVSVHCILIFTHVKKNNLAKNFELLHEIDKIFEALGSKRNFRNLKRIRWYHVIIQGSIFIFYMVTITCLSPVMNAPKDIPLVIVKYAPTFNVIVLQFVCCSLIYVIVINFQALNKVIEHIDVINDQTIGQSSLTGRVWRKTTLESRNLNVMEKLDLIWKAYAKICDCSFTLNEYFSMSMFAITAVTFLNTLFNTFYLMISIKELSNGNHIIWEFLLIYLLQLLMNVFVVFTIVKACNMTEEEASETSRLINNMMAVTQDEDIADKLHLISIHMLHTFPRFSAAGLFPVNNTLHFTMVGAVTTYMVILFQFSEQAQNTGKK